MSLRLQWTIWSQNQARYAILKLEKPWEPIEGCGHTLLAKGLGYQG